jgi:hypothetical protein
MKGMRLSDYKNEAALELFADMMEPAGVILADEEVKEAFSAQPMDKAGIVRLLMKKHRSEVLEIIRLIDGGDPKTYTISFLEIPLKLMDLLGDPEVIMLFTPQGQNAESDASGSAMGNTEEDGK